MARDRAGALRWATYYDEQGNCVHTAEIPSMPGELDIIYDDDAFHCLAGRGYCWRFYDKPYSGDRNLMVVCGGDATEKGDQWFCCFEDALRDFTLRFPSAFANVTFSGGAA